MKTKLLVLGVFLVISQFSLVNAQQTGHSSIVTYPIPSYNTIITALGYAEFEEGYSDFMLNQTEGKRLMNIQPKPNSPGGSDRKSVV